MKVEIPTLLEPEMPTFITSLTKVNANYARFTHFDGDMFNASYLKSVVRLALVSFLILYNRGSFQPSTTEPGTYWVKDVTDGAVDLGLLESFDLGLEFFVEDGEVGFSLSGIWGARGVGRLTGATGKERAEVWFTKVAEARSTYPDGSVWPVASFPSRQGRAPYYPWWSPPHH
jgi:hypothetical protein